MRGIGGAIVLVGLLAALCAPASAGLRVGPASAGPRVGPATRPSDFNGDGRSDLAIASIQDGGTAPGQVNVLYGRASGLSTLGAQLWSFNSAGVPGASQGGDHFGFALASGDFNGDHRADLAIGAPDYSLPAQLGGQGGDGAVLILYGSATGLKAAGSQFWSLLSIGVDGDPASASSFGQSLAAGDFNGDGKADLAIGSGGDSGPSAVNVLYGSASGLSATGSQRWTRDSPGILGASEDGDGFADSLAAGDFNGDLRADLAIGATFDSSSGVQSSGGVNVIYGSAGGLTAAGNQLWTQNSPGIAGAAESNDDFGLDVATGDFNGDHHDDLVVGVAGEDIPGASGCCQGAVNIIYGSPSGLTATGNQLFDPETSGVAGTATDNEVFGLGLATGDFTGDGRDELAIGGYRGVIGGKESGLVTVLKGSSGGLISSGSAVWSQDSASVPGVAEPLDQFGYDVATGDYKGTESSDLVVGVPGESYGGTHSAGAVNVIYSNGTQLSGSGSQLWDRASSGVPGAPQVNGTFGFTVH